MWKKTKRALERLLLPMSDDISIDLLNQYRDGDDGAAEALFDRYLHRLIGLARTRLSAKLARRIDPEDVVQSAYRSFFRGAAAGDFDIQQSGDLWRLLAAITMNKLKMQARRHSAGKRNMGCEDSIALNPGTLGVAPERIAQDPKPEEVVAVVELLERAMAEMKPQQRKILELRLQSHKIEEIAEIVECSERTVRRLLDRVKIDLQKDLADTIA